MARGYRARLQAHRCTFAECAVPRPRKRRGGHRAPTAAAADALGRRWGAAQGWPRTFYHGSCAFTDNTPLPQPRPAAQGEEEPAQEEPPPIAGGRVGGTCGTVSPSAACQCCEGKDLDSDPWCSENYDKVCTQGGLPCVAAKHTATWPAELRGGAHTAPARRPPAPFPTEVSRRELWHCGRKNFRQVCLLRAEEPR